MMIARPDAQKHLIVYKHPTATSHVLASDVDWTSARLLQDGNPPNVAVMPPGGTRCPRKPALSEPVRRQVHGRQHLPGGDLLREDAAGPGLTFGGQMMSMRDPELDLRSRRERSDVRDPDRGPGPLHHRLHGQAAQGDNEQITLWLRQRMFQGSARRSEVLKGGQTTFMDLGAWRRIWRLRWA